MNVRGVKVDLFGGTARLDYDDGTSETWTVTRVYEPGLRAYLLRDGNGSHRGLIYRGRCVGYELPRLTMDDVGVRAIARAWFGGAPRGGDR